MHTKIASVMFMVLLASGAAQAAPKTKSVELVWTSSDGTTQTVVPIELDSDDTALGLDKIFDPFGFAQPESLCFNGDINQVCSVLSRMSKWAIKFYQNGEHGLAELKGCRLLGHGKTVQASVELSNDYESGKKKVTTEIDRCN